MGTRGFGIALAFAAALAGASGAGAQAPLPRMIGIVVPFSAGGSDDAVARAIATPHSARFGVPVIVENKAGAAGVVGADAFATSPRDGSVLLLTSSSFLTTAAAQPRLPYDPIAACAPVAMAGRGPTLFVVSSSTPYTSPAEVVAGAKASPRTLDYGTAGVASIAITSAKPHPAFPDLPPLASAAPGFNVDIRVGVFAPAGTAASNVERLYHETVSIAASPELASVLGPDGALPDAIGSATFARL